MLTPRRNLPGPGNRWALLGRAIQSRANVLLEGATEPARTVIAQGIHGRSWRNLGRMFVSLRLSALAEELPWPDLLAGDLDWVLKPLGLPAPAAGSIGTLHLEELDRLSPTRQAALGAALRDQDDLLLGAARGPRIIGGLAAPGEGEPPTALDPQIRRALAVVHVRLDAGSEWESLVREWTLELTPSATRLLRIEWW